MSPVRDGGIPTIGRHQAPSGTTLATRGKLKTGKTTWVAQATITPALWTGEAAIAPTLRWHPEFAIGLPGGLVMYGHIRYAIWKAELKGVTSDAQ